jgi:MSHA biogenesis protein MshI
VLNTVNTYLKRIPLWRSWIKRNNGVTRSDKICCFRISNHEAHLLLGSESENKIQIESQRILTYTKISELKSAFSDVVKELKLDTAECIWIMDPSHYQTILLEDLPVEPAEFQEAVRWKIKKLISFPVEDTIIDSFPVPLQKTFRAQKMIMVVVTRASYLQPIAEQLLQSGVNLQVIDIFELALRNIASMFEDDLMPVALIYMQKKHTTLIITRQKNLYMARRIDLDFDAVNNTTSESSSLEKLALEIQRSFDYFQSQWRIAAPSGVLFAADRLVVVDIASKLTAYLAISVKPCELSNIVVNTGGLSVEQQNKYLPLLGGFLRDEIIEHASTD